MRRPLFYAIVACSGLACLPPTLPAQPDRTLLAVFAHPDDERIIGPLLARYAREGRRVYLAIATDGNKGIRDFAGIPAGPALAQVRAAELQCAGNRLGIRPPLMLGLPDGELATFENLGKLRSEIRRLVAELKPNVVIAYGPEGGTGHPDHRMVSSVVSEVVQQLSDTTDIELFYASLPAERLATAPASRPMMNGTAARHLTVAVPFEPVDLRAAQGSFACHRSQYTAEEMGALNRTMEHVYSGRVYLRPWRGPGPRRTELFR